MRRLILLALLLPLAAHADRWEHQLAELMTQINAPEARPDHDAAREAIESHIREAEPRIKVALSAVMEAQERLRARREVDVVADEPAVTIGAAHYRGEADADALHLEVELGVTLGREGRFKEVPIIGDDALLKGVEVDGAPHAVYARDGYYLLATKRAGPLTIKARFSAPGEANERGEVEYLFHGVRAPISALDCRFTQPDIEPQVEGARRALVRREEGAARLTATLGGGAAIKLTGARDLGEVKAREARLFVEDLSLLSVDEGTLEMFVVLRYTILYAKHDRFEIALPEGWTLTSAEGQDPLRYEVERREAESVLVGRSDYPAEGRYEVSLWLRRDLGAEEADFAVQLPRALGVERQAGWLAVEVPGKLRLEERGRQELLALDMRQLPLEMLESAVSPILKAYHHDQPRFDLRLGVERLPEQALSEAAIDEATAYTVVTPNGQTLTELRLTLRDRLRSRLKLKPREGISLRSALLNGNPVKVSQDAEGWLRLPLRRSEAQERPDEFEVSVILEGQIEPFGWLGRSGVELPAVELPIRALRWSLFLPLRDDYGLVESLLPEQRRAGYVHWTRPLIDPEAEEERDEGEARAAPSLLSAETGSMPVRINVPRTGHRIDFRRYWLGGERPMELRFWHMRSWMRYPLWLLMAAFLALGALGALRWRRWRRALGLVLLAGAWIALEATDAGWTWGWICLGLSPIAAWAAWRDAWATRLYATVMGWLERPEVDSEPEPWTWARGGRVAWRVALSLAFIYFGWEVLELSWAVVSKVMA